MWRCVDSRGGLLVKRSSVLWYMAKSEFSVSPRALALVYLHCELHRSGAICILCCARRKAATIAGTQILAQRRFWTRYTIRDYSKLHEIRSQFKTYCLRYIAVSLANALQLSKTVIIIYHICAISDLFLHLSQLWGESILIL